MNCLHITASAGWRWSRRIVELDQLVEEMFALEFLAKGNAGYARYVIYPTGTAFPPLFYVYLRSCIYLQMLINETLVISFDVSRTGRPARYREARLIKWVSTRPGKTWSKWTMHLPGCIIFRSRERDRFIPLCRDKGARQKVKSISRSYQLRQFVDVVCGFRFMLIVPRERSDPTLRAISYILP